MARIYKYRKVIDAYTTHCLSEPDYAREGGERITELCTLDGETYVSVPDSVSLPNQSEQITVEEIILTEGLIELIKSESPHILLINQRIVERIREKYSINDEIKMIRVGSGAEVEEYSAYVEDCRSWGRIEKNKLITL